MIYKMQFRKDNNSYYQDLYYPGDKVFALSDIKITLSVEDAGCIEFTIYPDHPLYNEFLVRQSLVRVIRDIGWRQSYIIEAEVREITTNLDGTKNVYAVGNLAYFKEVVLEPMSYAGTVTRLQFIESIINRYNARVLSRQNIRFSAVRGIDWQAKVNPEGFKTDYATVYDLFAEWFLKPFGLYLKYENGVLVLTPLELFNHTAPVKEIKLGENLMSCIEEIDGNDLITSILPLGAKDDNGDRLNIASVNDGNISIQNATAVMTYGIAQKMIVYDDITDKQELKTAAQRDLDRLSAPNVTLTISALDLVDLGINSEPMDIGDRADITLQPFFENREMVITKAELYPQALKKNRYTFGIRRRAERI